MQLSSFSPVSMVEWHSMGLENDNNMGLEHDIRFHARALRGMREKIRRTYGVTERDLVLPEDLETSLESAIADALGAEKWQHRRDDWRQPLAEPDPQKNILDAQARTIMRNYANELFLQKVLAEKCDFTDNLESLPPQERYDLFYRDPLNIASMSAIYANHVTNETQATLTLFTQGMPDEAHAMHTFLAGKVLEWARVHLVGFSKLDPVGSAALPPSHHIKAFSRYWAKVAGEPGTTDESTLSGRYRTEHIRHPRHTTALLDQKERADKAWDITP